MTKRLVEIGLATETCCNCGMIFAMPYQLKQEREEDGKSFYCPNGHSQHYVIGETDKDKIIRLSNELANTQQKLIRLKTRITNGVCPQCHRHFENVERHMQTQHSG